MKILFYPDLTKDIFNKLKAWINQYTDATCSYAEEYPDIIVGFNNRVMWDEVTPFVKSKPVRAMYFLSQPRPYADAQWHDSMEETAELYSYGKCMAETQYKAFKFLPYPVDITVIPEILLSDTIKAVRSISGYRKDNFGLNWYKTYRAKRECEELGIPVTTLYGLPHPRYFDELIKHNLYIGRFSLPGNIGRQELEAGASGLAVIGGFTECMDMFKTMDNDFPFIAVTKDEFKPYVSLLTIEEVKRLGRLNRDWMHEHYTPEKIAQYWVNKLKEVI